jgi:hypothetical protein
VTALCIKWLSSNEKAGHRLLYVLQKKSYGHPATRPVMKKWTKLEIKKNFIYMIRMKVVVMLDPNDQT